MLPAAPFGVVFNAYDPIKGMGALFGNTAAAPLWGDEALQPITGVAVGAALWLSLYGFEGLPGNPGVSIDAVPHVLENGG